MTNQLSLMLLDRVCEKSAMRSKRRCLQRWKRHVDQSARDAERTAALKYRDELEAEYATARRFLLQQEQLFLKENSRAMSEEKASIIRECEARQAQEVAQYKAALGRQRQRLLQMADAWGKQQAEHSALSAETDEMLRLQQQRAGEIHTASASKIVNLESAVAARQNAVQSAESKLRDMEGMFTMMCVIVTRLCKSFLLSE